MYGEIQVDKVSKAFGGVQALSEVSLTLRPGAVHGLVGANGAGKSTLIRVLAGAVLPDSGQILIDGKAVEIGSPTAASNLRLAFIHQEMSLIPGWDVLRNMALGIKPHTHAGIIDWRPLRARAQAVAERVGMQFSLTTLVDDLTTADQWLVMIGRALMGESRMIAMDEPTASLSAQEAGKLHAIIRSLTDDGEAVVFVSHRLDEVAGLCDDVTVFRDGKTVESAVGRKLSKPELVRAIVGGEVETVGRSESAAVVGEAVLAVESVSDRKKLRDVSLEVRAGEVVGLGGLVGAGRTELARIIYGAEKLTSGRVLYQGKPVRFAEPADAVAKGIGLVPEERRAQGIFLEESIAFNINIATISELRARWLPWLKMRKGRERAQAAADLVTVKAPNVGVKAGKLSGGNQQKVALARWMVDRPQLLILDEPSRGVDVGARAEIHRLVRQFAAEGSAVLAISSDNEELEVLCDRVVVMAEGRVAGELQGQEITQARILELSFNRESEGE
ncbi:MAG: sugar ABC transporter ATP-binding protein [Propionibacteriaceae bacterium]|jgi:ABC-type sugar transport system ATPase subunit|nr:sugar ABC transporter ATP-binding protein [Propionibacteriaceae bacterium]